MVKRRQGALCLFRDEVLAVFAHYRTFHPRFMPTPSPASKEWHTVCARLQEGFTVGDLCGAIDGCHRTPHNLGENDRKQKYLAMELIVRNASQVTRFLEAPKVPPKPNNAYKPPVGFRSTLEATEEDMEEHHATIAAVLDSLKKGRRESCD